MEGDYYTPPSEKIFDEIKSAAMLIWSSYSDEFGYRSGKLERIQHLKNFSDNARMIVGMFDQQNKEKLSQLISQEARDFLRKGMELAYEDTEGDLEKWTTF